MRVARVIERTRAEGPGLRFAIWVQGCELRCPGCYAEALQPRSGGMEISARRIVDRIGQIQNELEGITLLGGEPFLQAGELRQVAEAAQNMGLSVLTFTGHLHEELLIGRDPEHMALLEHTDVLLDGPYISRRRSFSRPLLGSDNQRYIFLSTRYTLSDMLACKNSIEIRIAKNGEILLNGMGDFPEIEKLFGTNDIVKGGAAHGILRF